MEASYFGISKLGAERGPSNSPDSQNAIILSIP